MEKLFFWYDSNSSRFSSGFHRATLKCYFYLNVLLHVANICIWYNRGLQPGGHSHFCVLRGLGGSPSRKCGIFSISKSCNHTNSINTKPKSQPPIAQRMISCSKFNSSSSVFKYLVTIKVRESEMKIIHFVRFSTSWCPLLMSDVFFAYFLTASINFWRWEKSTRLYSQLGFKIPIYKTGLNDPK